MPYPSIYQRSLYFSATQNCLLKCMEMSSENVGVFSLFSLFFFVVVNVKDSLNGHLERKAFR